VAGSTGIEIVVRDCSLERIAAWLDAIAGPLTTPTDAGGATVYDTHLGPVVVQPEMEGPGGVGIWFRSAVLPWGSPVACARQAARELGCVAWCEPGGDYPDVPPLAPVFLEVDAHGERLIEPPEAEPRAAPDAGR
jgi:hypothetical protein